MRQLYTKKKTSSKGFIIIAIVVAIAFMVFQKFNQGSFFNKANNKNTDNIVAQINGENIYQKEVEQKYKTLLSANENVNLSNLPASVLEILIRDVYIDKKILLETQHSNIVNISEIEEKTNDFKTKLLRSSYLDALTKYSIDEQKILDKFNEITKQIDAKNEYYFQQIVLSTKEDAEKVYKQIFAKKKSLKFVNALKKYSKDRANFSESENFIAEDQIKPEVVAVLNVIKDTQVSQPFAVDNEWLIVKRMAVKLPEKLDIENYREKIKQILLKDEIEKIIGNLVKDANIKILIPTKAEEKAVELKPQEQSSTQEEVPTQDEGSATQETPTQDEGSATQETPTQDAVTQESATQQNEATEKPEEQPNEKQPPTQPNNRSVEQN